MTHQFLNEEFEVERAYGEMREEALKKAGIMTYFIVRAKRPFQPAKTKSLASLNEVEYVQQNSSTVQNTTGRTKEDSEEFRQRLREELDSRGMILLFFFFL